jgi:hypothetical protein
MDYNADYSSVNYILDHCEFGQVTDLKLECIAEEFWYHSNSYKLLGEPV